MTSLPVESVWNEQNGFGLFCWCSVDERKSLLSKDGRWPHQERGRRSASAPHFLAACLAQRRPSFIQEKQNIVIDLKKPTLHPVLVEPFLVPLGLLASS